MQKTTLGLPLYEKSDQFNITGENGLNTAMQIVNDKLEQYANTMITSKYKNNSKPATIKDTQLEKEYTGTLQEEYIHTGNLVACNVRIAATEAIKGTNGLIILNVDYPIKQDRPEQASETNVYSSGFVFNTKNAAGSRMMPFMVNRTQNGYVIYIEADLLPAATPIMFSCAYKTNKNSVDLSRIEQLVDQINGEVV